MRLDSAPSCLLGKDLSPVSNPAIGKRCKDAFVGSTAAGAPGSQDFFVCLFAPVSRVLPDAAPGSLKAHQEEVTKPSNERTNFINGEAAARKTDVGGHQAGACVAGHTCSLS